MKKSLRKLIREELSNIFEEEDYISAFDFEDIPDMEPGGKAHQAFLKDLQQEPSFGNYKEPTEDELRDIIQGLKTANLDLPSEQELVNQAEEMLDRQLNPDEVDKIKTVKKNMEKMWGKGSFN